MLLAEEEETVEGVRESVVWAVVVIVVGLERVGVGLKWSWGKCCSVVVV